MRTRVMRKSNMVNFYSGHSSARNESSFEQWGTGNPCLKKNKKKSQKAKSGCARRFCLRFQASVDLRRKNKETAGIRENPSEIDF